MRTAADTPAGQAPPVAPEGTPEVAPERTPEVAPERTPEVAPERTPVGLTASEQLSQAFKGTMTALRRLRGRESQRLGQLSYAQYSMLFGLAAEPELPASRLAAVAELSPATVTQMLDHLEADGLVTRTRSARDKRVVLISLTDSGLELVRERREHFEPRLQAALDGFSDAELLTAAAVLDRLRAMFDDIDER